MDGPKWAVRDRYTSKQHVCTTIELDKLMPEMGGVIYHLPIGYRTPLPRKVVQPFNAFHMRT